MAGSAVTDVDAYLAAADPEWRAALERLRALALANLPGHTEEILYAMPCYTVGGESRFSFAGRKGYVTLYGLRASANALGLGDSLDGKGCIRFKKPQMIDFAMVERLLQHRAGS